METPDANIEGIEKVSAQTDVGAALRLAREGLGLSIADVANRIKFAPKQVEALEANDFEHLPQAAFLRGFVRSYARALQLDERALIAALPTDPALQAVAGARIAEVPFPTVQSLRRINVLWLAGALGVALILAMFVLMHESAPVVKPAEVLVEPVTLPLPLPAASAVPVAASQADPVKLPDETKVPELNPAIEPKTVVEPAKAAEPKKIAEVKKVEPAKSAETKKVAETVKPVESKRPVAVPKPATVPAVGSTYKPTVPLEVLKRRPIHFVFNKDAWVEVIDANGTILLSKTNQGSSEQWIGGPRRAPYKVSIAHPDNVRLYYKGREIDLSAYASMETAHLKVE